MAQVASAAGAKRKKPEIIRVYDAPHFVSPGAPVRACSVRGVRGPGAS